MERAQISVVLNLLVVVQFEEQAFLMLVTFMMIECFYLDGIKIYKGSWNEYDT